VRAVVRYRRSRCAGKSGRRGRCPVVGEGWPVGSSAVRTENLTKRYGRLTALDGLHLEVGAGEVCGFSAPESRHGRARPSSTPDSPSARHWPAPGTCSRSPSSAVAPPYWPPVSRPAPFSRSVPVHPPRHGPRPAGQLARRRSHDRHRAGRHRRRRRRLPAAGPAPI